MSLMMSGVVARCTRAASTVVSSTAMRMNRQQQQQQRIVPLLWTTTFNARRSYCESPDQRTVSVMEATPKVKALADEISKLTLIEASSLTDVLRQVLNIKDTPVMAVGAAMPAAATGDATEEENAVPEKDRTFKIVLKAFDATTKVKLIREIKSLMGDMNLVQAKKFVESAPQTVKEGIKKEEADKIVEALKAVGGTIELE